jgi:hypothetical protein
MSLEQWAFVAQILSAGATVLPIARVIQGRARVLLGTLALCANSYLVPIVLSSREPIMYLTMVVGLLGASSRLPRLLHAGEDA